MTLLHDTATLPADSVLTYPLHAALLGRRSRRFARGATLDGGPLAFESAAAPEPLTLAEEGALAFAAAGVTGHTLGELPYERGRDPESGAGNIMVHFVGRTVASGDALHSVTLFVLNDEGTWLVRRPQDFAPGDVRALVASAREGRLADVYERSRVRVRPERATVERRVPIFTPFNLWDANIPGSTYFIPVTELTSLYINVLLTAFSDELGLFIVDDRNNFRPAGLKPFARSRGGKLHDDVADCRVVTVSFFEATLAAMAAVEEGAMHQSLALMAEALGLGGFTHACRAPQWLPALGFDTVRVPFSRAFGLGAIKRLLMRLLRKPDPLLELAVGVRDPQSPPAWLLRAFCPPHYANMEDAVRAFVDYKFAEGSGTVRGAGPGPWRDTPGMRRRIPAYSEHAVAATVAYCSYLHERYGRFPATFAPFDTLLAYQAHHLDAEFYHQFYEPGAIGRRQRDHHHAGDGR
jgi:hypothetical protein